jgi:hypothetical protein
VTVKMRAKLSGRSFMAIICIFGAVLPSLEAPALALSGKQQVYITASFLDRQSLYIENLQASEIQIFENGSPKKIELIARDEIPVIYGLLFDRSLLMDNRSDRLHDLMGGIAHTSMAQDMAYSLIDKYLRQQSMWVAAYDREFHLELASTIDAFKIKEVIYQMHTGPKLEGSFAYAGLYAAVMKMNQCHEKRRVIILFIDTLDPDSAGKITQLKNLLSASSVELIIISFASKLAPSTGMSPAANHGALAELAQATAGEAYFLADAGGYLEDLARRINNQIRTFYTFGFESDAPSDTKTPLVIRCTRPGSRVKHHPITPILSLP